MMNLPFPLVTGPPDLLSSLLKIVFYFPCKVPSLSVVKSHYLFWVLLLTVPFTCEPNEHANLSYFHSVGIWDQVTTKILFDC